MGPHWLRAPSAVGQDELRGDADLVDAHNLVREKVLHAAVGALQHMSGLRGQQRLVPCGASVVFAALARHSVVLLLMH